MSLTKSMLENLTDPRVRLRPYGTIRPSPRQRFFRMHRSYIVNLDRVYELRTRSEGEWELELDPPVNKVLRVSRRRMDDLRELLKIHAFHRSW